jgi:hypothetical protein
MARQSIQDTPAELKSGAFDSRPNSVEKKPATQGDSRMSKNAVRILLFFFATIALLGNDSTFADPNPAIRLAVDATQAPQKIIRVHMVIPAAPGPLKLFYPK